MVRNNINFLIEKPLFANKENWNSIIRQIKKKNLHVV